MRCETKVYFLYLASVTRNLKLAVCEEKIMEYDIL